MTAYVWTWIRGAAYLTRADGLTFENAVNLLREREDYVAAVFPDQVTPDLAKWRTYVGRERALRSQDLDGALFHVRSVLHNDNIPTIPEIP